MRRTVLGILAHVDAGKTTLSEALLYESGAIRALGRVDHRDAFLDTDALERERGVTIFSKQACLQQGDWEAVLLDTPGHVDFSAEAERVLRVLDCAVVVVSGTDGVQSHTLTLWRLLKRYEIPVFFFVNKLDLPGADAEAVLAELKARLDGACVDFTSTEEDAAHGTVPTSGESAPGKRGGRGKPASPFGGDTANASAEPLSLGANTYEEIALCDESALEGFLETNTVPEDTIRDLIRRRKLFPCFCGSALQLRGVWDLLRGLAQFAPSPTYPEKFGARIFKITRDGKGNRLTWMKVTGGTLKIKAMLSHSGAGGSSDWAGKAEQIRVYSGEKFQTLDAAPAGTVCAVVGLDRARSGEGLGLEPDWTGPALEPVLSCEILLPEGTDPHTALGYFRQLEEEDPALRVSWNSAARSIRVRLMGEIQREILERLLRDRFQLTVSFGPETVTYRETIAAPVTGVGHFEPLRHYAEVHLLLEPLPSGSGLVLATACPEDALDRNWQRLILSHLAEREHPGVLTGSPITDMRITLLTGRAHLKHTEGGDFREAVYRALRQGLMSAESVLLEPWYGFTMELPAPQSGRAMTDIRRMGGEGNLTEDGGYGAGNGTGMGSDGGGSPNGTGGGTVLLTGSAPVSKLKDYASELRSYTKGEGRLNLYAAGYRPCGDTEAVVAEIGYDPERDPDNPPGSIFCAHGAGYYVPWQEVPNLAHIRVDRRTADGAAMGDAEAWDLADFDMWDTVDDHAENAKAGASSENAGGGTGISSHSSGTANGGTGDPSGAAVSRRDFALTLAQEKELKAIFERTYGPAKERREAQIREARPAAKHAGSSPDSGASAPAGPEYLLVDGYNIIFAWEELTAMARENLDAARAALCDLLCGYQGVRGCEVIVVFDAYKVKGNPGSHERYHNIHVVYTKEAETADAYIERATYEIGRHHRVRVATSDGPEQLIILGHGALRLSASMFREEMEQTRIFIAEVIAKQNRPGRTGAVREAMERAMEKRERET